MSQKKKTSKNLFADLELGKEEAYDPSEQNVLAFKVVGDPIDCINYRYSNMANGFPFDFAGMTYKNSEQLYLLGEFSTEGARSIEIQEDILSAPNGYAAKRFKKAKYKAEVREDFHEFRLQWMLFVVWQKCKESAAFRKHLFDAPTDAILVENTTSDNQGTAEIWGCRNPELIKERTVLANKLRAVNPTLPKKDLERLILVETNKIRNVGTWKGQNNLGKILLICRRALQMGIQPPIDYTLLSHYEIYILGRKVDFAVYAKEDSEATQLSMGAVKYNANDFRLVEIANTICAVSGVKLPFDVIRRAIHKGLSPTSTGNLGTHDFFMFKKRRLREDVEISGLEKIILGVLSDIDKKTQELDALMLKAIETDNFKDWTFKFKERQMMFAELASLTDEYIRQNIGEEVNAWTYADQKNTECKQAIATLEKEKPRLTETEYKTILAPIQCGLDETRRFALHMLITRLYCQTPRHNE